MANTVFDAAKITGGTFTPVSGTAIELGCTGSLSGETDVRIVTKTCEGNPVKEVSVPRFMNLTFSGHLDVEAYRSLFGLKADETVLTKFVYGSASKNPMGSFEWTGGEPRRNRRKDDRIPECSGKHWIHFLV